MQVNSAPMRQFGFSLLALALLFSLGPMVVARERNDVWKAELAVQTTGPASVLAKAEKAIPFEPYRNLIFLPVRINNSKPSWFVLDSGANTCAIDQARAKELRLKLEEGAKGIGLGGGTFDIAVTRDISFGLPGMNLSIARVAVVDLSSFRLVFGRPVDGILGYEFFASYVVVVDNDKHTVTFSDPRTYIYVGHGEKIPLIMEENLPCIMAKLKVSGQDAAELKFVIDTGSASAVANDLMEKASSRKLEIVTGVGLGNETKGVASRVEKLQLGSCAIENAVGRTGKSLIGGEILGRFNIVFDYSRRLIILDANRRFRDPYLYDTSGLVLRLADNFKHFRVHAVIGDSPAAEAGLRRGDTITAINGRPTAGYKLPEVQRLFQQRGKEHRLDIRRGDERRQITIQLRELL